MRIIPALVLSLAWAAGLPPARPATPVALTISSGDSWWLGRWLPVDSPASLRESTELWSKALHVTRLYWRGQQEEMMLDYGQIRPQNLEYYEFIAGWERHLMKDVGLNRIAAEEAHRHGMEIYFLAPLFDFAAAADSGGCKEYPYYGQINFTLEHPEWMPVDRYGIRRQNGPIALCYPAARRAIIEMYLHYLGRDHLDGISFFTYCENYSLRFGDEYGFNQPIVEEYQRRYGVDIRTQEFDPHLWNYLQGEYVTQFLRELKAELARRGKKLSVTINAREPNQAQPWSVSGYVLTTGRIYLDWERWVREGLVDELVVAGSEPEELRRRTVDNILKAARGTPVTVATSAKMSSPAMEFYARQGVSSTLFATDDNSYVKMAYPEQPADCLQRSDPYAQMRFLYQVGDGRAQATLAAIAPFAQSPRLLVRRAALAALSRLPDPAGLPILENALHEDPERSVRTAAAFALLDRHGPQSISKLIRAVREMREFQLFEAAATTLAAIDQIYLPEIAALASDPDDLLRRLGVYVLGRRGGPQGRPILVRALHDTSLFVRFLAARGLQAYTGQPDVVAALLATLDDPDPVVQDRAALSLATMLVKGSTVPPRFGLESSIGILRTEPGPLPNLALDATQVHVLDALTRKFSEFGQGTSRSDREWGYRAVGNSILAFGREGGFRLQHFIDQTADKPLAVFAWKVLYSREGMENFCLIPSQEDEDALIYRTYPLPLDSTPWKN